MGTYYIRYYSQTAASLQSAKDKQAHSLAAWRFSFPHQAVEMVLSDSIRTIDNVNLHTGLNIVVNLNASSSEDAKESSKEFAEMLLTLVNFVTLASCRPAKLVSVINAADKENISPVQFSSPLLAKDEILYKTRTVDSSHFHALFDAYGSNSHTHPERTIRSLSWLRKGIGEKNTIDEFLSFYFAVEIISCILRDKLRYKTKKPGLWDGIKQILAKKVGFQDFDTASKARKDLVHGLREIDNVFMKEIKTYLEPLRKGLVFAIGDILALEENVLVSIASKTPLKTPEGQIIQEGTLKRLPSDFDKLVENYPSIEIGETGVQFSIGKEGNPQVTVKPSYTFRGPPNVVFKLTKGELWM